MEKKCAYCRYNFPKVFILLNTDKYFCKEYLGIRVSEKDYERYFKSQNKINKIKTKWPYNKNNSLIRCQHCKERFKYDTLISYFTAKIKSKDYKPECFHCHKEFDEKFMYDNFEETFCKNVLNLHNPYKCCVCQINDSWKLNLIDNTCKNCGEKICKECLKKIIKNEECKCQKCNNVIINRFKDYYVCNCGVINYKKEYHCQYCNKFSLYYLLIYIIDYLLALYKIYITIFRYYTCKKIKV